MSGRGRIGRWLGAGLLLFARRGGFGRPRPPELPEHRPDERAEVIVAGLLLLTAAAGAAFVALYVAHPSTQWLGVSLGVGLAALAAAAILAGARLVPQETAQEERPQLEQPEEEERLTATIVEPGRGISRRRLLLGAGGVAGLAMATAAAVPIASLGPRVTTRLGRAAWSRGRLLVDEGGTPLQAAAINVGGFVTAFPQGADKEELGSPIVVVRLLPEEIHLPPERAAWAPQGLLAFSKICTHAGCAVSLFRYPLDRAHDPKPALVCPCHYSTFDVGSGGHRIFGPAGRALPQLPLEIDSQGLLRAAGGFSGPVGPSWLLVRK